METWQVSKLSWVELSQNPSNILQMLLVQVMSHPDHFYWNDLPDNTQKLFKINFSWDSWNLVNILEKHKIKKRN